MEKTHEQLVAEALSIVGKAQDAALDKMAKAVDAAADKLAKDAENAIKVISVAAAEAKTVTANVSGCDHDLLIVLGSKMQDILADLKEIKNNGFEGRIGSLEIWRAAVTAASGGQSNLWNKIIVGLLALITIATFIIPYLKR